MQIKELMVARETEGALGRKNQANQADRFTTRLLALVDLAGQTLGRSRQGGRNDPDALALDRELHGGRR